MSAMSASEKPEFCSPTRRGSRTAWVAVTNKQKDTVSERRDRSGREAGLGSRNRQDTHVGWASRVGRQDPSGRPGGWGVLDPAQRWGSRFNKIPDRWSVRCRTGCWQNTVA